MFRKMLVLLLCCCLTIPFAACGKRGSDSDSLLPGDGSSETNSSVNENSDSNRDTDEESDASTSEKKLSAEDILAASDRLVGLTDQLNGRIIICDLAVEDWTDDNAVVWEYSNPSFKHIAGIKFRDSEYYGEKVVIFCYPVGACVMSYETKEILFQTSDIGWNPHSVELLPDGTFIVASSTDNLVCVFAPGEEYACQKLEFPNAHGVLWDPSFNVVWMVGMNQLSAYSVSQTGEPELTPVNGMTYYAPDAGMHDLAPIYGDENGLLITCSAGIMKFDKEKEEFNYSYSGGKVGKAVSYAPGVGNFEDGVLAYTSIVSGKTVYQSWCTNEVRVYIPLNDVRGSTLIRKAPDDAYYKLRVVNFNYQ